MQGSGLHGSEKIKGKINMQSIKKEIDDPNRLWFGVTCWTLIGHCSGPELVPLSWFKFIHNLLWLVCSSLLLHVKDLQELRLTQLENSSHCHWARIKSLKASQRKVTNLNHCSQSPRPKMSTLVDPFQSSSLHLPLLPVIQLCGTVHQLSALSSTWH